MPINNTVKARAPKASLITYFCTNFLLYLGVVIFTFAASMIFMKNENHSQRLLELALLLGVCCFILYNMNFTLFLFAGVIFVIGMRGMIKGVRGNDHHFQQAALMISDKDETNEEEIESMMVNDVERRASTHPLRMEESAQEPH